MHLKLWGTRGSVPSPGPETIRYGGSIVATSTATAVIGRDYISYDAPGPGEELDFVLDVHRFKVGTTRVQPFTLGPLTFSG